MAFSSMCEHCFETFPVSPKGAGKRVTCPLCGVSTVIDPTVSETTTTSLPKKRSDSASGSVNERAHRNSSKKKSGGSHSRRSSFDISKLILPLAALMGLIVLGVCVWYFAPGAGRVRAQKRFASEHGEARTTKEWLDFIRNDEQQKALAREKGQKHTFEDVIRKHVSGDPKNVIGTDPAAIPDLFEALRDDQPRRVQEVADEVLKKFAGSSEKPFLEDITVGMQHPNPRVVNWATRLLAKLGPEAKQMLPQLAKTLEAGDRAAAVGAANTLAAIGPDALPALIAALDKPNADVTAAVIQAIGRMGTAAESAVPKIATFLGHDENSLRFAALNALESLGSLAKPAVPNLVAFLETGTSEKEVNEVTKLLAKPQLESTEALIRLLRSNSVRTQKRAIAVLNGLDKSAAMAVPVLKELASQPADDNEHRDLQNAVSRLLAKLGNANLPGNVAVPLPVDPAGPPPAGAIEALEEVTLQVLRARINGKQVGDTKRTGEIGGNRGQFGTHIEVTDYFDEATQTKAQLSNRRVNEIKNVGSNDARRRTNPKLDLDLTMGKSVQEVVGRENVDTLSWSQGNRNHVGQFVDEKREGRWTRTHANGRVWVMGTYHKGQKNGQFVVRDDAGKRLWIGLYQDDRLLGMPKRNTDDRFHKLVLDAEASLVQFDPSGHRLAVAQGDHLAVFDCETWEECGRNSFASAILKIEFAKSAQACLVTLAGENRTETNIVCHGTTGEVILELPPNVSQPRLSPEGKWIAGFLRTANHADELVVYDVVNRQVKSTLDDSGQAIFGFGSFCFSTDDQWLALGGQSSSVLLDVASGKIHQRYNVALSNILFAANNDWLLGATRNGQRAKIDRVTGEASGFGWNAGDEVRLTTDGEFLVELYHKSTRAPVPFLEKVLAINLRTGKETLSQQFGEFAPVLVSSNAESLALIDNERGIVRSLRTGETIKQLPELFTGALSNDGRFVAAFETHFQRGNQRVQLIHVSSDQRQVFELPAPRSHLAYPLSFSPNGTCLVACQRDRSLSVWNLVEFAKRPNAPVVPADVPARPTHRFDEWKQVAIRQSELNITANNREQEPAYYGFVFTSDQKRFLAHNATYVRQWQSEGTPKTAIASVQPENSGRAVLSSDGKILCCGNTNGSLNFWDMKKGELLSPTKSEPSRGATRQVCFSPDGKLVASADGDAKTVRLWDVSKRTLQKKVLVRRDEVLGVAFGGTDTQLAVLDAGGNLLITNPDNDNPTQVKLSSGSSFDRLYSLPKSQLWLILQYQHGAKLTLVPFAAPHAPVEIPLKLSANDTSIPVDCSVTHDEEFVAMASEFRVILASLKERQVTRILHGHFGNVVGVAFSPDDKHLVTSGQDGTLRVWGNEPFPYPLEATLVTPKPKANSQDKSKKR